MNNIFLVFLSLSVSGSILALILLVINPLIKKRLSQTWQYYIWLIVILRFLLPFSTEVTLIGEISNYFEHLSNSSYEINKKEIINVNGVNSAGQSVDSLQTSNPIIPDDGTKSPVKPFYWEGIRNNIWMIWLAVAFILLVHTIMSYHGYIRFVKAEAKATATQHHLDIYINELEKAKIKRILPLYINRQVASPMLIGLFRPAIILPVLDINDNELRQIFRHELTHYRRLDAIYKWLIQIVICIHWFNPLVYWIRKEINRCCELSCDENIIKNLDVGSRIIYGDALIASLNEQGKCGNFDVSLTMGDNAYLIKERLDMLMIYKKKSRFAVCVTFLLTILFLCSFSLLGVYASSTNDSNKADNGYDSSPSQPKIANLASIFNSYYAYNDTDAYRLIKSKALKRFLNQWTTASIVNPVWNYDSFTKYEGKDLYYCTFTADNGKYYYMVLKYQAEDGGGLSKVRYCETPYDYDLRANIDELTAKLSETAVNLSSAVASRVQAVNADTRSLFEAIRITDDSGHSYMYYLGKSSEKRQFSQNSTSKATPLSEYAKWEVTYKDGIFYYRDHKVRLFMDMAADNSFKNFSYNKKGSVDLRLIRNSKGLIVKSEYISKDEAEELLSDFDESSSAVSSGNMSGSLDKTSPESKKTSEDIIRQTTEDLPDNIQKAIGSCDNKLWYVIDGQDRRYIYYNGLARDYAYQYTPNENSLIITDIGKLTDNYVLLSIPLNSNLKITYHSHTVTYTKITVS
ncbi:M56 family metallopeptidase [Anaerocolumna sp. MB42-C2]|uniref:M56 family metallopeptidase n=1 Tax=Anaerocolumna sp. MB42-C2 TaxID=3070997 RepID=UPI0027E11474|nr:M56 family metallopeptidase [Anaerocolumna sp. MB42-C2]WMJ86602.1 M56 family metallopeptidase [Anaerocolumna sp. MB42-C2]